MEILTLIIKQCYFDEIIAGTKKQEFREIKPSSNKKYCEIDEEGYSKVVDGIIIPRHYDAIRFYVGYNKDRDSALVEVKKAEIFLFVDENDEFIVLQQNGEDYYAAQIVYDLGEILEVKKK